MDYKKVQVSHPRIYAALVPTLCWRRELEADYLKFVSGYGDNIGRNEAPNSENSPFMGYTESQQSISPQHGRSTNDLRAAPVQIRSAERYEFALHGLLALGGRESGGNAERGFGASSSCIPSTEPGRSRDAFDQLQLDSIGVVEPQNSRNSRSWPPVSATPIVESLKMTEELVLEYLTHYRYKIAPWVSANLI